MNRREKALLLFAAAKLEARAATVGGHPFGSHEMQLEQKAKAFAFRVSADYLRGLAGGHEKVPPLAELLAAGEKNDQQAAIAIRAAHAVWGTILGSVPLPAGALERMEKQPPPPGARLPSDPVSERACAS